MIGNKQTLRSGILGLLSFLLILAAACSGNKNESRAVILIIIDTLRADRISGLGYERATTPYWDSLLPSGTAFTNAWSTSSWTPPAMVSLMTGLYPTRHGSGHAGADAGTRLHAMT